MSLVYVKKGDHGVLVDAGSNLEKRLTDDGYEPGEMPELAPHGQGALLPKIPNALPHPDNAGSIHTSGNMTDAKHVEFQARLANERAAAARRAAGADRDAEAKNVAADAARARAEQAKTDAAAAAARVQADKDADAKTKAKAR